MRITKLFWGFIGIGAGALLLNCCIPSREASCPTDHECGAGTVCNLETHHCESNSDLMEPPNDPPPPDCTTESQCSDAKACVNNKCVVCQLHDDCGSKLCEPAKPPSTNNRCLNANQVYVVDATADSGKCSAADGSVANPFCKLQDALAAMPYRYAIRLVGSKAFDVEYTGPFDLGKMENRTFRIFGSGPANPDQGRPVLTAGAMDTILTIAPTSGQTKVILDGVSILRANGGVDCKIGGAVDRPQLQVYRSLLSESKLYGIRTSNCDIMVARSTLRSLPRMALFIEAGIYAITDNFLIKNGGDPNARESPITLFNSDGLFAHNTVVANSAAALAGLNSVNCDKATKVVLQASIIHPEPGKAPVSQFSGSCELKGVVVHPSETYASAGRILAAASFSSSEPTPFALRDDATNTQCCIDKIDALSATDYFGTKRPQGAGQADIGAHEVR